MNFALTVMFKIPYQNQCCNFSGISSVVPLWGFRRFAADCVKDEEESRNDYLLKCQSTLREECLKHQESFHTVLDVLSISEVSQGNQFILLHPQFQSGIISILSVRFLK